ncbi:phage tail tape measure protein [Ancylobacter polymorphus]|uniref:Phage tail tape measure protein n=1 Tax=Ancylobacter polymorphus TaxID=223390 RepID=A0A9E6ZZF0_9HYPH|nr:phage tail tape measure protein [Ancylobacter polymorphus]UOK73017.1 phage tail tape measure protein [Ancylobacter polymorphus]
MAKGLVVGSLRAMLGLDTAEFDDGVERVNRGAKGLAANLRNGLASAANVVSSAALGMGAALAGIGFAGVAAAVRNTAAEMATLSDEAKRAGLSITAFQEWKFVAEQNRIGLDAMIDGFKELNLRADEFIVTGGGSAADAFQRLGYGAEDLKEKLKDPSALMLEIIDRVGQLDKAAQIRVFDELLGGSGGEQIVQLIDQGSAGIKRTIDRAHELNRVIGEDTVKSAVELDKQFRELSTTVDTYLKTAIVESAAALRGFLDMLKKPGDQELTTIRDRLKEIERIAASTGTQRFWYETQYGGKGLPWLEQERDNLQMMLKLREQSQPVQFGGDLLPPTSTPPPATTGGGAGRAQPSETDQLAARVESLRQSLMTEAELEEQSYAQRMETLAAYYEGREGMEGEWRDLSLRAQQEYADNMNAIAERQAARDQQIRDMTWRGVSDTLGSLSDLAATFGEKGFLASKAFGIGQAVVNTAVGVTEALKLPPPANFAAAAAVAAAGAAQIASIAAARPGGSSRPSVPYSSVATAAPAGSNDSASRAPAFVEIKGDVFSRQAVIELMAQISDLMGDGYELKY